MIYIVNDLGEIYADDAGYFRLLEVEIPLSWASLFGKPVVGKFENYWLAYRQSLRQKAKSNPSSGS